MNGLLSRPPKLPPLSYLPPWQLESQNALGRKSSTFRRPRGSPPRKEKPHHYHPVLSRSRVTTSYPIMPCQDPIKALLKATHTSEYTLWRKTMSFFGEGPSRLVPDNEEVYNDRIAYLVDSKKLPTILNTNWSERICIKFSAIICCPVFHENLEFSITPSKWPSIIDWALLLLVIGRCRFFRVFGLIIS